MARNGYRHRLVLYTFMIDRWWKLTLGIGIALILLAAGLGGLPSVLPGYRFLWVDDMVLWVAGGAGAAAILLTFFLIAIRKSAYVQPFPTHLRLVTPFLRMNISYRRIRQASTSEIQRLFPVERSKGVRRRLLRKFATQTAIVLVMQGWPLPRWALGMFLSPFFFPDKSSRLALLVPDWMAFSTDMESFRGTWLDNQRQQAQSPQNQLFQNIGQRRH
jgi:hypothetical protein